MYLEFHPELFQLNWNEKRIDLVNESHRGTGVTRVSFLFPPLPVVVVCVALEHHQCRFVSSLSIEEKKKTLFSFSLHNTFSIEVLNHLVLLPFLFSDTLLKSIGPQRMLFLTIYLHQALLLFVF